MLRLIIVFSRLKRRDSAENRQQERRMNAIERHLNSIATPRSVQGRRDRPFFMTNIRVFLRTYGVPENLTTWCQRSGNSGWFDRALTYTQSMFGAKIRRKNNNKSAENYHFYCH